MTAPLPLARDTAFAWIEKGGDASGVERYLATRRTPKKPISRPPRLPSRPWKATTTRRRTQPRRYLARQWRDFDELARHQAAGRRFGELAERLYGPLHYMVKVTQKQMSGTAKRQPRGDKS